MEKERKKTGDTPFHTAAEAEVMTALGTTERGLSSAESSARLERYGPNDVSQIRQRPLLVQYLSHFKNLLVIILILAALVSIFAGELTSAVIIIVIVVASVTLDFFQEYKAGNAAELAQAEDHHEGRSLAGRGVAGAAHHRARPGRYHLSFSW